MNVRWRESAHTANVRAVIVLIGVATLLATLASFLRPSVAPNQLRGQLPAAHEALDVVSPPPLPVRPSIFADDYLEILGAQLVELTRCLEAWRETPVLDHSRAILQTGQSLDHNAELRAGWIAKSPQSRYELILDTAAQATVHDTFRRAPAFLALYDALPRKILRLDLFRYAMLWAQGGLYVDTDTECLIPPKDWPISANILRDPSIELVVGVEIDELDASDDAVAIWGWPHRFGFLTWTIWGRRHSDALRYVLLEVARRFVDFARLHGMTEESSPTFRELPVSEVDILQLTGPGAFTAGLARYLGRDDQLGANYTISSLSGLTEPTTVSSVAVLPVTYFAAGAAHSRSGPADDPKACVRHHYNGSWRGADDR